MESSDREVTFSPDASEEHRRFLQELVEQTDAQVSAVKAAARERVVNPAEGGKDAPQEIQITITVGPNKGGGGHKEPAAEAETFTTCSTVTEICGKSETGYIYCEVEYCMTVGPITILPPE